MVTSKGSLTSPAGSIQTNFCWYIETLRTHRSHNIRIFKNQLPTAFSPVLENGSQDPSRPRSGVESNNSSHLSIIDDAGVQGVSCGQFPIVGRRTMNASVTAMLFATRSFRPAASVVSRMPFTQAVRIPVYSGSSWECKLKVRCASLSPIVAVPISDIDMARLRMPKVRRTALFYLEKYTRGISSLDV